jgi:hypothetical protein
VIPTTRIVPSIDSPKPVMDRRNPNRKSKERVSIYGTDSHRKRGGTDKTESRKLSHSDRGTQNDPVYVRRSKTWVCNACTLVNSNRRRKCEICATSRPIASTPDSTSIHSINSDSDNKNSKGTNSIKAISHPPSSQDEDCYGKTSKKKKLSASLEKYPKISALVKQRKRRRISTRREINVQIRLNGKIEFEKARASLHRGLPNCDSKDDIFATPNLVNIERTNEKITITSPSYNTITSQAIHNSDISASKCTPMTDKIQNFHRSVDSHLRNTHTTEQGELIRDRLEIPREHPNQSSENMYKENMNLHQQHVITTENINEHQQQKEATTLDRHNVNSSPTQMIEGMECQEQRIVIPHNLLPPPESSNINKSIQKCNADPDNEEKIRGERCNATIQISEESMARSYALLREDDIHHSASIGVASDSSRASQAPNSTNAKISGVSAMFSSARGTAITVSDEGMARADALLREDDIHHSASIGVASGSSRASQAPNATNAKISGVSAMFSSARGTAITISDEGMARADALLREDDSHSNNADSVIIPQSFCKTDDLSCCEKRSATRWPSISSPNQSPPVVTQSSFIQERNIRNKLLVVDSSIKNTTITPVSINFLIPGAGLESENQGVIETPYFDRKKMKSFRFSIDGIKISLSELASKYGPMHRDYNFCVKAGVRNIVLLITSENSSRIRFDNDGFPSTFSDLGASDTLHVNDLRKELIKVGCCDALLNEKWIANHYRWVVWKLASMERRFPLFLANEYLTLGHVTDQLKKRYLKEIQSAHRPILRKVLNRDVAASTLMILCVSRVHVGKGKNREMKLCLSDGWYEIPALLDNHLQQFVCSGKIAIGTKLVICNALLEGADDGVDPLDNHYQGAVQSFSIRLKLFANSTRKCKWSAKLGIVAPNRANQSLDGVFGTYSFKDVIPGGGAVPTMDLILCKQYPMMYMEERKGSGSLEESKRAVTEAQHALNQKTSEDIQYGLVEKMTESAHRECAEVSILVVHYKLLF